MHVLFPGSFDPITLGHMDIIRRASHLFDRVTVGVFQNESKHYLFTPEERLEMVKTACAPLPNVDAALDFGFVADFCQRESIPLLVRGVRGEEDLPFERMAADFNRARGIETVLLLANESTADLSSTEVRRLMEENKDISPLVPPEILPFLLKKAKKER